MENIKFIDITQLPDDLWQDAKNLIALDSNGEVIKAAKQDSYSKDEIDDLLKDAEISADKLQNKIKINSASTDYVVTQPTVSGDSLVITDSMSDKNQYHTFGYDKTITTTSNKLLDYSTPLFRGTNEYNCPQWDGNSIRFQFISGMKFRSRLTIPYKYNGVKYVTHIDAYIQSAMFFIEFGYINDQNFVGYQSVPFKKSEVYKTYGAYEIFSAKIGASMKNYDSQGGTTFYDYIYPNNEIQITIGNFPLTASNGALIIETPRFYILSNNFIYGDVPTESQSSDHPERLNDYIRYSNDVKAYILTDKNTKFKTINGNQITGDGNIEISTDVDLSNLATKSELATKQDTLISGTNIKSINGTSLLSSGNMELATKEELNTKQDVISDLETIRSGAALGATALQSVPSEYATEQWVNEQGFLKEHQDISNLATKSELNAKQDTLVSGTNIKTINGTSLLGSGNIVIEASSDNVPTLQTTPKGTTSNYIYSTGIDNGYGVISDITNSITYSTDKASIATWKQYWGEESSMSYQSWSIKGATTSQAGLMSASDKSKLDGIDLSTKQDTLVSGTNIKTVNGTSLLGSGNIVIEASSDNVPTLQTTKQGTTSNYIYSSGKNDYYGVISNIETAISYDKDIASIHTDWYYWGNTYNMVDGAAGWSIKGATTSQAGLMTASDKSKLDGIDISTKQDKLVSGTNIKTINGTSLLGSGDITIEGGSGNVDLSDYYTKSETNALVNPKLSQVTLTQAEYDALQTKENNVLYIISDASTTDSSDYYTKAEIDSMIGGVSSTITEINNLVV